MNLNFGLSALGIFQVATVLCSGSTSTASSAPSASSLGSGHRGRAGSSGSLRFPAVDLLTAASLSPSRPSAFRCGRRDSLAAGTGPPSLTGLPALWPPARLHGAGVAWPSRDSNAHAGDALWHTAAVRSRSSASWLGRSTSGGLGSVHRRAEVHAPRTGSGGPTRRRLCSWNAEASALPGSASPLHHPRNEAVACFARLVAIRLDLRIRNQGHDYRCFFFILSEIRGSIIAILFVHRCRLFHVFARAGKASWHTAALRSGQLRRGWAAAPRAGWISASPCPGPCNSSDRVRGTDPQTPQLAKAQRLPLFLGQPSPGFRQASRSWARLAPVMLGFMPVARSLALQVLLSLGRRSSSASYLGEDVSSGSSAPGGGR